LATLAHFFTKILSMGHTGFFWVSKWQKIALKNKNVAHDTQNKNVEFAEAQ